MRKMMTVIGLGLAGIALAACGSTKSARSAPEAPAVARPAAMVKVVAPVAVPAPRTASGYAAAFRSLPAEEWMGADLGVTVPVGSGRTVWLFGDTLSRFRFVHSTAITQTGGTFHVSARGAQLLPNDDANHIYWLESGRYLGHGRLALVARKITITDAGNPWGFRDEGKVRTAYVALSGSGDLRFLAWGATKAEANNAGSFLSCARYGGAPASATHICYSLHIHPELKLAGGRVLVSVAQNWTDGAAAHKLADGSVNWRDWSLLFSSAL